MYAVKEVSREEWLFRGLAIAICLAMVGLTVMPAMNIIVLRNSKVGYLVWYYAGGIKLPEPWKGVTKIIATGTGGAIGGWAAARIGARIGGTIGSFIAGPWGTVIGGIAGAV